MFQHRTVLARGVLTLLLVLAMHMAGMGRALATAARGGNPQPLVIAGIVTPICHTGRPTNDGAPSEQTHDCCDQCALCAPVALPGAPPWFAPVRVIHVLLHAQAIEWAPVLGRPRTPRLAQGPPAA